MARRIPINRGEDLSSGVQKLGACTVRKGRLVSDLIRRAILVYLKKN